MLFHSTTFLFVFLPVVLAGFYLVVRAGTGPAIAWLTLASLVFYAAWDWRFLGVLLPSILLNFLIGEAIRREADPTRRKRIMIGGIVADLLALGVFKYTGFVLGTVNAALGGPVVPVPLIELPLGISFFTFTQIAYLVDVARGKATERDPVAYGLFVTFFPHLIAGPILHHAEMMPQFRQAGLGRFQSERFQAACALFLIGLFKKLVLADTFAQWASPGFDHGGDLSLVEAWATTLCYTFQLYFDFSGYSDMAVALGRMVNIELPRNFASPYRATNIQDFWNRWHITLSRFLREYVYIPLGGNRHGEPRTLANLVMVFLVGGLWHGAGWTFLAWGAIHGIGMAVHRVWQAAGLRLPAALGWLLTFLTFHGSLVLFRSPDFGRAMEIYAGMIGLHGVTLPEQLLTVAPALRHLFDGVGALPYAGGGLMMGLVEMSLFLSVGAALIALPRDSLSLRGWALFLAAGLAFPFVVQRVLFVQTASPFLYFQF